MPGAISKLVIELRDNLRSKFGAGVISLFIAVPPVPASRPRVTRFGGVYYGAPYKKFYDAAQAALKSIPGSFKRLSSDTEIVMLIDCAVDKPRTGKLPFPRGDADNFAKGPLDAMVKVERFLTDDKQIGLLSIAKRYTEKDEDPGVAIDYAAVEKA